MNYMADGSKKTTAKSLDRGADSHGIRLTEILPWLEAGAAAVGMGGGLRSNGPGTALREAVLAIANRAETQTR